MPRHAQHGLPPVRRLRHRGEFQRVFDQGRRLHGRYFTIIVAPSASSADRLGIVASRKLGNAVTRNRAKRLIREVFRHSFGTGPARDVVVIPRTGMTTVSLETLAREFQATLERGGRMSKK
ncbi:MAG TPA: ribonuclease P protein component [Gemmatimonadaceae bacterium]